MYSVNVHCTYCQVAAYRLLVKSSPKPSPVRRTLSPDRILDAATRVLDADGPDAISMRRLGSELGVAAMALYNHFPSRDALLDALANRALGGIAIPSADTDPRQRLRGIFDGIHALATEHPHLYTVAITRPARPRAAGQLMLAGLEALRAAGLSESAAVRWYHTALMLLQGYPAWRANQSAALTQSTATLSTADQKHLLAIQASAPPDQFKHSLDLLLKLLPAER